MEKMTYYVVEVSFREGNPIHRAICYHQSGGHITLFGSYSNDIIKIKTSALNHFKVIEKIEAMCD